MAWIESHTVLSRHRKLIGFAADLRIRKSYAMGHLTSLWHTALEQQENGDLSAWTPSMIADYSDYPGRPPILVRALLRHGWLDQDMKLHDWWQYCGPYLRSKYKRNPERWEAIRNRYVTVAVTVTQPYTVPNRTEPNLTNLTNRTDGKERTVDLSDQLKTAIDEVAAKKSRFFTEHRLLSLVWKFGEHNGRKVQDIPAEYCQWALNGGLTGIGQEYKDALRIRLDQKISEGVR